MNISSKKIPQSRILCDKGLKSESNIASVVGVTLSVTAYRRATSPRVGGKVYVAGTMCNTETNPNLNEPPTVGWEAVEYTARTKVMA